MNVHTHILIVFGTPWLRGDFSEIHLFASIYLMWVRPAVQNLCFTRTAPRVIAQTLLTYDAKGVIILKPAPSLSLSYFLPL